MKSNTFEIAGRKIGENYSPYIIAEMSANHNGSLENAFAIIEQAKACGADAIKLQTYTADTMTLQSTDPDFMIDEGLWAGRNLYDLYTEAHLPWEWHPAIFEHARKIGITAFSTPFDRTAVDFLESLNVPAYKIASFEAIDLPLIQYVAMTKKPMIISTGLADMEEINEAVDTAMSNGCKNLALLHCVSSYPAPPENYNLKTIVDMAERYGVTIGLSDHTIDNATAITSIALGASIVEKHFTLDRNGGGADDSFSLEPKDLEALCQQSEIAWKSLGKVDYGKKSSEIANAKFRRSLYFVKDLSSGSVITEDVVRSVRPGYGMAPKYITQIIGRKINQNVSKNSPVRLEHFDNLID